MIIVVLFLDGLLLAYWLAVLFDYLESIESKLPDRSLGPPPVLFMLAIDDRRYFDSEVDIL